MTHAGGRPRTVSFSPDEMIVLGEEMIKWVKENDPLHLSAWYSIEKGFMDSEWDTMIKRPEFVPYYEQSLKIVGQKYLHKDSKVREGISQRWQRMYFPDLRKMEDADADAEAVRKASSLKSETHAVEEYRQEVTEKIKRKNSIANE